MLRLKHVDLSFNGFTEVKGFCVLRQMPSLQSIIFNDNPVTIQNPDAADILLEFCPWVTSLNNERIPSRQRRRHRVYHSKQQECSILSTRLPSERHCGTLASRTAFDAELDWRVLQNLWLCNEMDCRSRTSSLSHEILMPAHSALQARVEKEQRNRRCAAIQQLKTPSASQLDSHIIYSDLYFEQLIKVHRLSPLAPDHCLSFAV